MTGYFKKIDKINFGLMSPEDIRAMSVVTIETPDTYEDDGFPIEKGLMDPRLGVIDPSLVCRTCGFRGGDCQGHFGNIELARPVIHIGFGDVIHKILRSTCNECGRVLLSNDQIEEFSQKIHEAMDNRESLNNILKEVYKIAKIETKNLPEDDEEVDPKHCCPHCGAPQEAIILDKPVTIRQGDYRLSAEEVRERLERISDEDAFILGVNPEVARPEWLVLTVLPVPPVTIRPSITLDTGERSEDDLTHKLVDILRINQRLLENMEAGAPQLIVDDLWELLQYHVTTYFDNEASGVPPARHRSGRPLKTLTQRLKGKEGRFRSNLSGKRVNFSARTVISPDPNISINEVGVPEMIAKEVTVPVYVTEFNINEIKKYIENGPGIHPGANYIITNNRKLRIRNEETKELILEQLEPGFIVERHLKDGDIVLLNRQPSLHRQSMMAHEVRILPYKTFRINPCVCPPYNADFDGDEMNMHIFQSIEARAEAKSLMRVQEHILSPRFGGPIIGAIHDHISGAFLLTKNTSVFSEEEALQIIRKSHLKMPELIDNQWILKYDSNFGQESFIYKNKGDTWTGKELFSLLLPNDLNLEYAAEISGGKEKTVVYEYDKESGKKLAKIGYKDLVYPTEGYVVIKNGILLQGVIDESAFGSFSGKILDKIVKEYGSGRAKEFLDKSTDMAIYAITKFGITTSFNDEEIPEEAQDRINWHLEKKMDEVDKFVEAYEEGYLKPLQGRSLEETLEMKIMQVLGEARDMSGSIAAEYILNDDDSSLFSVLGNNSAVMAKTGARASMLNLTQITACVGQQSVRGGRIERGYLGRTLPHFKKGELGAKAKGFVHSSYKSGLDPIEFFFHAMGGREGLVDTAIRTAQSGYMQRRLVNALQDLSVDFNGVVKDNNGNVIQTLFGDDGVDPVKSDFGKPADLDRLINEIRLEENLSEDELKFRELKSEINKLSNNYKSLYTKLKDEIGFFENNSLVHRFNSILLEVEDAIDSLEYSKKIEDADLISKNAEKYDLKYQSVICDYEKETERAFNLNKYFFKKQVIDKTNTFKKPISEISDLISRLIKNEQLILDKTTRLSDEVNALKGNFTQNLENDRSTILINLNHIINYLTNNSLINNFSFDLSKINNKFGNLKEFDRINAEFSEEFSELEFYINTLLNNIKKYKNTLDNYKLQLENEINSYDILVNNLKDIQKIINKLPQYEGIISQIEVTFNNQMNRMNSIENDVEELTNTLLRFGNNLQSNLKVQKDNILDNLDQFIIDLEFNERFEEELNKHISSIKDSLDSPIKFSSEKNDYVDEFYKVESRINKVQNEIVDNENKVNNFEKEFNDLKSKYDKLIEDINKHKESEDSPQKPTDELYDQLINYNDLLQSGIITQEEFDELKRQLIFGKDNINVGKDEDNEFLNNFKTFINGPIYGFIRNSFGIPEKDANNILNEIESEIIEGKITDGDIKEIVKNRFSEFNQEDHIASLTKQLNELLDNSSFYKDLSVEFNDLSHDEKTECIDQLKDSFNSDFKQENIKPNLKILFENKRKEKHDLNSLNNYRNNINIYMSKYNLLENEVVAIFDIVQYDIIESKLVGIDFERYIAKKFTEKVAENKKNARYKLSLYSNKKSKIKELTRLNDSQVDRLIDEIGLLISQNKLKEDDITEELFVEYSLKINVRF